MINETDPFWMVSVEIYIFDLHIEVENPASNRNYLLWLQISKSFRFAEGVWGLGRRIIKGMIEIANAIRTHRVFITKKNKYVNLTISILIPKSIHSNYMFKYLP